MAKRNEKKGQGFFKRHHKGLLITGIVIYALIVVLICLPMTTGIPKIPSVDTYEGDNQYITFTDRTLISAHRAGASLAPENTLAAFEYCMNSDYRIDILEFDLHITSDGVLVLLHDETLDRTSNSKEYFGKKNVKAQEKTYAELLNLNMAESFETDDGKMPYKGLRGDEIPANVRIVSLETVLEYVEKFGEFKYIIEIKNSDDLGRKAMDELYRIMVEYGILNRTVVGTFNGEISDYMDEKYPDVTRSAGISEVLGFYFSCMFNVDLSKKDVKYKVLQIPYKQFVLNLGKKTIIDYAHKHGIAVQFWTINDEQEIRDLVERGADAIITDSPDIANKVIFGS